MKRLTLIVALVCSISAFSVNIISNGTFENATFSLGWTKMTSGSGAQASEAETTAPLSGFKSLKSTVTTSGGSANTIYCFQQIALVKAATYKITFKAKASIADNMTVQITNSTLTGTLVTSHTFALTTSVQTFTWTFDNTNLCPYNFLQFQYGNLPSGTIVYLDDISVEEVTSPLTDGNLCNGDFEANYALGRPVYVLTGYSTSQEPNSGWSMFKLSTQAGSLIGYLTPNYPISGSKSLQFNIGTCSSGATNASYMTGWAFTAVMGKKYTCTFKAKVSTGTFNAGIKLISYDGSVTNFDNINGVALTTTAQTFTFTSNAISSTSFFPFYILCFQYGNLTPGVNITIDDVQLNIADLETPSGVSNATKLNSQVFVNAANQIVIESPEEVNVFIYNVMGQKQYENKLTSTKKIVDKKFGAGIYLVELTVNGHSEIHKVIIR